MHDLPCEKIMTPKEKLLERLPIKYRDRVEDLTEEDGLIDDCKYLLSWTKNYTDGECYGSTFPVKSISEAVRFVKESLFR